MTKSQELIKEAGIKQRLQLGIKQEGGGVISTGSHAVIFLNDRVVRGMHPITGTERPEVQYTFRENGVEKTYNSPVKNSQGELNYFVIRMAEFEYGDSLVLEMKKKGIKNYVNITSDKKSGVSENVGNIEIGGLGGGTIQDEDPDEVPFEEN